jgi:hypothetical protein
MSTGTNARSKPLFEGQIVRFRSPHVNNVWLYDVCKRNPRYGCLEWWALNDPTDQQKKQATIEA